MPLIALTGGIASGKSTIARRLAQLGAVVVDADAIVRDVQAPGSDVSASIADRFGAHLIDADGALDRAALAAVVFADSTAREQLNAIVHPAVQAESRRRIGEALSQQPDALVVYDVPLLVEARAEDSWELVVVAHAPAHVRMRRLRDLRGLSEEQAAARIAAQAPDEERLAVADVVIDTSGAIEETISQTDQLWHRLMSAR